MSRLRSSRPLSSIRRECGFMVETVPRTLRAASAFPDLRGSAEPRHAGVLVCERNPQLVTMIAYKGRRSDVSARLEAYCGLALPLGPRRVAKGESAVIGLGPGTWLFQREAGPPLAAGLSEALGDAAAVTDQSDGYATMRLTGPRAAAVLEKGIPSISTTLHSRRALRRRPAVRTLASFSGGWRTQTAIPFTRSPCSAASRVACGISSRRVQPSSGSPSRR